MGTITQHGYRYCSGVNCWGMESTFLDAHKLNREKVGLLGGEKISFVLDPVDNTSMDKQGRRKVKLSNIWLTIY